MFSKQVWAVVGSHGRNPIAAQLVARLEGLGKTVHELNPKVTGVESLSALDPLPEVVNLVISPRIGPDVVEEMDKAGIRCLFVQPGAAFEGIDEFCEERGIEVRHGCVLVDAPPPGSLSENGGAGEEL